MVSKLTKQQYPKNHSPLDFKCFGPAATKDGEFNNTYICDMGCFTQDGKDTNKMYHAAIVQSTINNKWYVYFEWGRTGAAKISFQFIECGSKAEAEAQYCKQLHAKNDRRGQWITTEIGKILQAKPGKDCYLVRALATRSTGLPDAKTITTLDVVKPKQINKTKSNLDKETELLLRDLKLGTVSYTRSSMADSSIPTQAAIDEARDILKHAMQRTKSLSFDDQLHDSELTKYTKLLYSRIPKVKELKASTTSWILSKDNISIWQQDLDAFESALNGIDIDDNNPLEGMQLKIRHLSRKDKIGEFIYNWVPTATRNKHSYIKTISIYNIWEINRIEENNRFDLKQKNLLNNLKNITERPILQPKNRIDLSNEQNELYSKTNTALLFHGTRSVNVSGILKEGFRFPKELVNVIITGAMFSGGGAGIYMSDDFKKSVGYTSAKNSYWSGGSGSIKNRHAFLFLCDIICGNPHVATKPYPYIKYPDGTHCIFGKAGFSGVQNNEWIILDKNQYKIRYLIEFGV